MDVHPHAVQRQRAVSGDVRPLVEERRVLTNRPRGQCDTRRHSGVSVEAGTLEAVEDKRLALSKNRKRPDAPSRSESQSELGQDEHGEGHPGQGGGAARAEVDGEAGQDGDACPEGEPRGRERLVRGLRSGRQRPKGERSEERETDASGQHDRGAPQGSRPREVESRSEAQGKDDEKRRTRVDMKARQPGHQHVEHGEGRRSRSQGHQGPCHPGRQETAHVAVAQERETGNAGDQREEAGVEVGLPGEDPAAPVGHRERRPLPPLERPAVGEGEGRGGAVALRDELQEREQHGGRKRQRRRERQGESPQAGEGPMSRPLAGRQGPPQQEEPDPEPGHPGDLGVPAEELQRQGRGEGGEPGGGECVLQAQCQKEEQRDVAGSVDVRGLTRRQPGHEGRAPQDARGRQPRRPALEAEGTSERQHPEEAEGIVADREDQERRRRVQKQIEQVRWVEDGGLGVGQEGTPEPHVGVPQRKPARAQRLRRVDLVGQVQLEPVRPLEEGRREQIRDRDQGDGGGEDEKRLAPHSPIEAHRRPCLRAARKASRALRCSGLTRRRAALDRRSRTRRAMAA